MKAKYFIDDTLLYPLAFSFMISRCRSNIIQFSRLDINSHNKTSDIRLFISLYLRFF